MRLQLTTHHLHRQQQTNVLILINCKKVINIYFLSYLRCTSMTALHIIVWIEFLTSSRKKVFEKRIKKHQFLHQTTEIDRFRDGVPVQIYQIYGKSVSSFTSIVVAFLFSIRSGRFQWQNKSTLNRLQFCPYRFFQRSNVTSEFICLYERNLALFETNNFAENRNQLSLNVQNLYRVRISSVQGSLYAIRLNFGYTVFFGTLRLILASVLMKNQRLRQVLYKFFNFLRFVRKQNRLMQELILIFDPLLNNLCPE